jgi:hypothetical protein
MAGSGIDPKIDFVFKRLFGDDRRALLLIDLLNAVVWLPAGKRISQIEILNPTLERDHLHDKLSILDVKVRDEVNRHFLLETELVRNVCTAHERISRAVLCLRKSLKRNSLRYAKHCLFRTRNNNGQLLTLGPHTNYLPRQCDPEGLDSLLSLFSFSATLYPCRAYVATGFCKQVRKLPHVTIMRP